MCEQRTEKVRLQNDSLIQNFCVSLQILKNDCVSNWFLPLAVDVIVRKMKRILYFLILVLFASCESFDVQQLRQHPTYLVEMEDADWVVRFDEVSDDQLTGRAYKADRLVSEAHPFTAKIGRKSCTLNMPGVAERVTIRIRKEGERVKCRAGAPLPKHFSIKPLDIPDYKAFTAQYESPLYKVKVKKDVVYAKAEGYWSQYPDADESFAKIYARKIPNLLMGMQPLDLKMDIYEPDDGGSSRRPMMVFVHGGAFFNGDKQDDPIVKWCRHYASLGYVVVSPNYRMGFVPYREAIDKAGYRAVQDVHAAVRYMLHRASTYRINPDWVFVGGSSAGAITALNVAFMRDKDRPQTVLDEGKIAKLATDCPEKVKVRAVANLWGAVHDTLILQNSPSTAIISFHGDADAIVPYGHDYPFRSILNPAGGVIGHDDGGKSPGANKGNSLHDQMISKMFGSYCIDRYAHRHGMRSRLFTKKGGGHSLHVDEHRNIVPYFYTIRDSVARFFYGEMVPVPLRLRHSADRPLEFRYDNANIAEIYWKVTGGVLLEESPKAVRVLFFSDESKRSLTFSGKYKNGVEFSKTVKY